MFKNKKADIGWETIGKLILVLFLLVVILMIIGLMTQKGQEILQHIKDIFRFW
ncbi:hypothetical protein KY339_02795 [Candidatus Woesearchaeota archaeon]|nr:hypothetical protein [Candidatus Woesearchaeota archaeon]